MGATIGVDVLRAAVCGGHPVFVLLRFLLAEVEKGEEIQADLAEIIAAAANSLHEIMDTEVVARGKGKGTTKGTTKGKKGKKGKDRSSSCFARFAIASYSACSTCCWPDQPAARQPSGNISVTLK